MFVCVRLLLHSHLMFEQAIAAAPAAVLTAQGEVEVRCFSPRMQPLLTRSLVLQVSAMLEVQAKKVRVLLPCVWVQYVCSELCCMHHASPSRLTLLTHDVRLPPPPALQANPTSLLQREVATLL